MIKQLDITYGLLGWFMLRLHIFKVIICHIIFQIKKSVIENEGGEWESEI